MILWSSNDAHVLVLQNVCVVCGMILEGFILSARILLVMSPLKRKNLLIFIFEREYFQDGVFVFYSQYGWSPYRMEDVDTQFELSDGISRWPCYNRLDSFFRQDCWKVWALLECLELWTKLLEPQSFVICALLLRTTSDVSPHVTMIFDWSQILILQNVCVVCGNILKKLGYLFTICWFHCRDKIVERFGHC